MWWMLLGAAGWICFEWTVLRWIDRVTRDTERIDEQMTEEARNDYGNADQAE